MSGTRLIVSHCCFPASSNFVRMRIPESGRRVWIIWQDAYRISPRMPRRRASSPWFEKRRKSVWRRRTTPCPSWRDISALGEHAIRGSRAHFRGCDPTFWVFGVIDDFYKLQYTKYRAPKSAKMGHTHQKCAMGWRTESVPVWRIFGGTAPALRFSGAIGSID